MSTAIIIMIEMSNFISGSQRTWCFIHVSQCCRAILARCLTSPACWRSVLQKSMGEGQWIIQAYALRTCHLRASSATINQLCAHPLHACHPHRQLAEARRKLEEAAAERADLRTDLAAVRRCCHLTPAPSRSPCHDVVDSNGARQLHSVGLVPYMSHRLRYRCGTASWWRTGRLARRGAEPPTWSRSCRSTRRSRRPQW